MRRWRALALVPLMAMLVVGPALAQDEASTPEADGVESTRLVGPEECVAEPRTPEDIATILNLDGEGIEPPASTTFTPPLGEMADTETKISVEEAIRTVLACFNAGDVLRASALMTEHGVQRAYWGLTFDQASRDVARDLIAAEPQPRQEEGLVRLLAVTDVSILPDGRVAAFAVINEPLAPPPGPETLLFILTNQDGQWLVDDRIIFTIVPTDFAVATPPATPAP